MIVQFLSAQDVFFFQSRQDFIRVFAGYGDEFMEEVAFVFYCKACSGQLICQVVGF